MRYTSGLLSVALIVVLLAACAPAAPELAVVEEQSLTAQDRQVVEEMLFQYEHDWVQVNFSRDRAALDRILADDLVYTLDTGEVIGKEAMIDLFVNDPTTYETIDLGSLQATWYADDLVLVIGSDSSTGTDADGNAVTPSGRFTNVFLERDGRWQCIVGHYTVLTE